jgi:chromate transporter
LRNAALVAATFIAIGVLRLPLLLVLAVLGPFGSWLMWRAVRQGPAAPRKE